jgi:hypothetical protein
VIKLFRVAWQQLPHLDLQVLHRRDKHSSEMQHRVYILCGFVHTFGDRAPPGRNVLAIMKVRQFLASALAVIGFHFSMINCWRIQQNSVPLFYSLVSSSALSMNFFTLFFAICFAILGVVSVQAHSYTDILIPSLNKAQKETESLDNVSDDVDSSNAITSGLVSSRIHTTVSPQRRLSETG